MPIPFNPVASDETGGRRLPVFAVGPGALLDPNERRIVLYLRKHDPDVCAPRILLLSVVFRTSGGQGPVGGSPDCKRWLIECRFCHVRWCRTPADHMPGSADLARGAEQPNAWLARVTCIRPVRPPPGTRHAHHSLST